MSQVYITKTERNNLYYLQPGQQKYWFLHNFYLLRLPSFLDRALTMCSMTSQCYSGAHDYSKLMATGLQSSTAISSKWPFCNHKWTSHECFYFIWFSVSCFTGTGHQTAICMRFCIISLVGSLYRTDLLLTSSHALSQQSPTHALCSSVGEILCNSLQLHSNPSPTGKWASSQTKALILRARQCINL